MKVRRESVSVFGLFFRLTVGSPSVEADDKFRFEWRHATQRMRRPLCGMNGKPRMVNHTKPVFAWCILILSDDDLFGASVEYFREPNNRIQAGFALNAGRLMVQYQEMAGSLPKASRYEATLAICVLQSLLTNCSELLDSMKRHLKEVWMEQLPDIPHKWGLKRGFVTLDTFPAPLTYERFIEHLRNAVSHPTTPDKKPKLPSTGYTTIPGSSGIIEAFRFTDSPWVSRGEDHSRYVHRDQTKMAKELDKFNKKYGCHLEALLNDKGAYQAMHDGQPYRPFFVAEIPLDGLIRIALELSNFLAQPTQERWDGRTVHQLLAS